MKLVRVKFSPSDLTAFKFQCLVTSQIFFHVYCCPWKDRVLCQFVVRSEKKNQYFAEIKFQVPLLHFRHCTFRIAVYVAPNLGYLDWLVTHKVEYLNSYYNFMV